MDQKAMRDGICAVINKRNLKQKVVADAMGVSVATVQKSIRGKRPFAFHEFTAFVAFVGMTPKDVLRAGGWKEAG